MITMKKILATIVAFGLTQAHAVELLKKDDATLNLGGRFQVLGVGQRVIDPYKDNNRIFLFLDQARINISGQVEDYKYFVEWALGAEEAVKNLNTSLSMMDMRADIPLTESQYVRIGQFKVGMGLEALANDGEFNFTTRSINHMVGVMGRDVGMAYVLQRKGYMGTFGIFTGGGRNNPERYLPEELGVPLMALRFGYDSAGTDPYNYSARGAKVTEDSMAAFANLAYMEDSRVGHSTVMSVKAIDKSLLLNANWNPYMTTTTGRSKYTQASFDAQKRFSVGNYNATAELEYTHAEYSNTNGKMQVNGGRLMGSMYFNPFEVSARYAVVYPTDEFKYKGKTITGVDPFQELAASASFFHRPWSRFTLEAVFHLNTPVVVEVGSSKVGSYMLVQQPDQVTVLDTAAGSYVERQFVPEGRFMYQLTF